MAEKDDEARSDSALNNPILEQFDDQQQQPSSGANDQQQSPHCCSNQADNQQVDDDSAASQAADEMNQLKLNDDDGDHGSAPRKVKPPPPADDDDKKKAKAEQVQLRLTDQNNNVMEFRVKRSTLMRKVLKVFSDKTHADPKNHKLVLDGEFIELDKSVGQNLDELAPDLDKEAPVDINVYSEQVGGGGGGAS